MPLAVYLIAFAVLAAILFWWFVGRNMPKYPPLELDPSDPAVVDARAKAKATLDILRNRAFSGAEPAQVKVAFLSSTGVKEYLWAEVLGFTGDSISVRYLTPPVTHTGRLERLHAHPMTDVSDWVVFDKDGRIYGAYTQRLMIKRARELGRRLPAEIEAQASRFAEADGS
jgi:uncharacterized protein YegJ (DUF2314 family)